MKSPKRKSVMNGFILLFMTFLLAACGSDNNGVNLGGGNGARNPGGSSASGEVGQILASRPCADGQPRVRFSFSAQSLSHSTINGFSANLQPIPGISGGFQRVNIGVNVDFNDVLAVYSYGAASTISHYELEVHLCQLGLFNPQSRIENAMALQIRLNSTAQQGGFYGGPSNGSFGYMQFLLTNPGNLQPIPMQIPFQAINL